MPAAGFSPLWHSTQYLSKTGCTSRKKLMGRSPRAAAPGSRLAPQRDAEFVAAPASSRVSWQPTQARRSPGWKLMNDLIRRNSIRFSSSNWSRAAYRPARASGSAVGLDRHVAQHADRVPVDHHRFHVRLVSLAAVGVAVGPRDPSPMRRYLTRFGSMPGPLGAFCTTGPRMARPVGRVGRIGGRGRGRSGIGEKHEIAGRGTQAPGPEHIDQVDRIAGRIDLLGHAVAVPKAP